MAKSFKLTSKDWSKVKQSITDTHGRTILMLRERCRRELGFNVRDQRDGWLDIVWLDFYDDFSQTMFLMKYGELISHSSDIFKNEVV